MGMVGDGVGIGGFASESRDQVHRIQMIGDFMRDGAEGEEALFIQFHQMTIKGLDLSIESLEGTVGGLNFRLLFFDEAGGGVSDNRIQGVIDDGKGEDLQLREQYVLALEGEEVLDQDVAQDGDFAEQFVEAVVLTPAKFSVGLAFFRGFFLFGTGMAKLLEQ